MSSPAYPSESLDGLIHIKHGFAFKSAHFGDQGKLVVLTPANFHEGGGFKVTGKERFYTGRFPDEYILRSGDLIIAMTEQAEGLLGSPAVIPADGTYLHNQRLGLVSVRDPERLDAQFLRWLFRLQWTRDQIRASSNGAKVRHTSPERIYRVEAPLPDKPTQRKIAAILSAYDDLIENNSQRIALLAKMAEEIYREWFVRLRFPGHEHTPSQKGVPEGWTVGKLIDVASMVFGQSPPSEHYNEVGDGLPFHQGVGSYGDRFPSHGTYCSVDGRTAEAGSILFSVRAPVGRLNITDRKVILGRGLAGLNERQGRNSYLWQLLKSNFSREDLIGNGAIFASVSKKELEGFPVFRPTEDLIERFQEVAEPIDQQIDGLHRSNGLLTDTRDLLLNRLISGKLRVDDLDIQFPPSMQEEAA